MRADFRSDTVTQPSAAMRAVMLDVPVGDDVLDGDPTVRLLEEEAAAWLGKPRAIFVPSGTMANQVALGAWTRPGDEIVCQRWAHITTYEGGAPGYLHGVQTLTIGNRSGRMDPDEVREATPAAQARLDELANQPPDFFDQYTVDVVCEGEGGREQEPLLDGCLEEEGWWERLRRRREGGTSVGGAASDGPGGGQTAQCAEMGPDDFCR